MTDLPALDLARTTGRIALDKKGFDVKILKLQDISSVCDYFVIVSGEADVHVKAIGNHIVDEMGKKGIKPYHKEGLSDGHWILLDFVDVVVHIFREPIRSFYSLEKLWGDAPVEELSEDT